MTRRLGRVLALCSLGIASAILLAGPGLHLLSHCEHEAHHDAAPGQPGDVDHCPVCAFQAHVKAPAPLASAIVGPSPAFDRIEAPSDPPPSSRACPSRLPRSPPLG